jgi:hypothetical protein
MSVEDYFPVRLQWNGRAGIIRSRYMVMTIHAPPVLPFSYVEIDFTPGACSLIRRRPPDRMDDMEPGEVEACRLFLARLDADPPDLAPDA